MIDRGCLSLNNICDINCKYCYFYNRDNIEVKNIVKFSFEEVKTIVENVLAYCREHSTTFKLGLVGSGEPLLSLKVIEELLIWVDNHEDAKKYIKFYTISNGYNTKEEAIRFLYNYKHLIDLSFSLDGYEELHNYSRVKHVKDTTIGTYDKVFETILRYESIFGHKPSINVTVHKQTILNWEKLMSFLIENNFKNVTFSKLFDCDKEDLAITEAEFQTFISNCDQINNGVICIRNIEVAGKKVDCGMYGAKCGVGKTNIFFANQKVYPCGRFLDNEKYLLGKFGEPISSIEKSLKKLTPNCCEKGCYYDKYVLKKESC